MIAALAMLRGLPWRVIAHALAIFGLVWFVYMRGEWAERARWVTAAAAQQAADALAVTARAKEDNQFAAKAISQQAQLQANYTQLQGEKLATRKQIQIIAPSAVALQAAPAAGQSAVLCPEPGPVPDAEPRLSLGAVWLWNSALSSASTPAGACQFDAATGRASAACADSSGLTVEAAWDNQAANAQSCALDRANHQRLIDFLTTREGTSP